MDDPKLEEYILGTVDRSIAAMAVAQVHEALRLIAAGLWPAHAQALRLAALRRYLRFQNLEHRDIHAHWAWTERETVNRLNEEPARTLMQRARAVQVAFAASNRSYALAISPVRSLARQVELWNGNSGVRTAAATLKTQMVRELEKPEYGRPPDNAAIDGFWPVLQNSTINLSQATPHRASRGTGRCAPSISS